MDVGTLSSSNGLTENDMMVGHKARPYGEYVELCDAVIGHMPDPTVNMLNCTAS